jgi:hypothetical protein
LHFCVLTNVALLPTCTGSCHAVFTPTAKEGATAVKRASGKAAPKVHGSVWSAESVAALKAVGAYSSRKKPDGWAFSRAPAHTGRLHRYDCIF